MAENKMIINSEYHGLENKYLELKRIIWEMQSAVIAFSGGVDSALVLKVAFDVLGSNAVAVTADSPSVPRREIEIAQRTAKKIGVSHFLLKTDETKNSSYLKNPEDRCYFCKSELYNKIREFAVKKEIRSMLNGTNFDDLDDYRPGLKAAEECQIRAPLAEAKITKQEVRELAKQIGLEIWDKPASPCLASRVPYGNEITLKKLKMIEDAENYLKDEFGVSELRVRHFGNTARIELRKEDFLVANDNIEKIRNGFENIGFNKVVLAEFKSGNLNKMLKILN